MERDQHCMQAWAEAQPTLHLYKQFFSWNFPTTAPSLETLF